MRLGVLAGATAAGAAVLAAMTACGSAAPPPVAAGSGPASSSPPSPAASVPVPPSGAGSGTVPAPIPAATLRALTSGQPASIAAVSAPGSALADAARSRAMAVRTALAQQPHGSEVLGLTLARVKGFGFGADASRATLVWLASVDPFGSNYAAGYPACGRLSYVVEFIDPATGRWLMTSSGRQPGLAPLPQLGPTPTLAQPAPSCGAQVPRAHLGTPAAS